MVKKKKKLLQKSMGKRKIGFYLGVIGKSFGEKILLAMVYTSLLKNKFQMIYDFNIFKI